MKNLLSKIPKDWMIAPAIILNAMFLVIVLFFLVRLMIWLVSKEADLLNKIFGPL